MIVMTFLDQLKEENILIVGFGYRTGLTTANCLLKKGITVSISDSKSKDQLSSLIKDLIGSIKRFYFGKQNISQLNDIDRVILSPGVPRTIPLIQQALQKKIPVTGEVELAYQLCHPKKLIGITGTDGKTTTTTLVYELLKQQFPVKMGGNIGIPFISFVDEVDENSIVLLELSSYQLEEVPHFKCDIAIFLNLSEDHLDRYDNFNHYLEAKRNIFKNQSEQDIAILNYDDPHYERISQGIKSQVRTFSKQNKKANIFTSDSKIIYKNKEVISLDEIKLKGVHNLENTLAAILIAKEVDVSNQVIQTVLKEFKGLPHRNEYIDSIQGIDFINDSKATTINSVTKSLLSQDKPIVLLMGGQDKGLNFSLLKPFLEKRVKQLILFGEAKEKIDKEIQFSPTLVLGNLEEAFTEAVRIAVAGDVVLLSPACTSFDQYENYEKRGNHFRELVFGWKINH